MGLIAACLVFVLSAFLGSLNAPPKTSTLMSLPSGKSIRVYSIQRMSFLDHSHPPSLLLRYETHLPVKDSLQLRAEVQEVWELLRPRADQAGDAYALVKANEPIRGLVAHTAGFTYEFVKDSDGNWRMLTP